MLVYRAHTDACALVHLVIREPARSSHSRSRSSGSSSSFHAPSINTQSHDAVTTCPIPRALLPHLRHPNMRPLAPPNRRLADMRARTLAQLHTRIHAYTHTRMHAIVRASLHACNIRYSSPYASAQAFSHPRMLDPYACSPNHTVCTIHPHAYAYAYAYAYT